MKRWLLLTLAVMLSACTTVEEGAAPKPDPIASARDRVALAAEYLRKGDNEHAQIQLKRALQNDPASAEAHNLMGVLLERDGDVNGAEKYYRKAIKLRPAYSQAYNNYGIFLFKNARYQEAAGQFEQAASDMGYENRTQAFEGMGRSLIRIGDNEGAARAFARALKQDATLSLATLGMAQAQYNLGNYNAAHDIYLRFLKLIENIPQSPESLWLGIRLERRYGDKNALASYELALRQLYPDSQEYKLYQQSLDVGSRM